MKNVIQYHDKTTDILLSLVLYNCITIPGLCPNQYILGRVGRPLRDDWSRDEFFTCRRLEIFHSWHSSCHALELSCTPLAEESAMPYREPPSNKALTVIATCHCSARCETHRWFSDDSQHPGGNFMTSTPDLLSFCNLLTARLSIDSIQDLVIPFWDLLRLFELLVWQMGLNMFSHIVFTPLLSNSCWTTIGEIMYFKCKWARYKRGLWRCYLENWENHLELWW